MDPNTLLVHEVDYELLIREFKSTKADIGSKRKALKKLIQKEKKKEEVTYRVEDLDIEQEKTEVEESVAALNDLIKNYDSNSRDAIMQKKKITSRIEHIRGRLRRLLIDDSEAMKLYKEFRDEMNILLLASECDIDSAEEEDASAKQMALLSTGDSNSQRLQTPSCTSTESRIEVPLKSSGKSIAVFKWNLTFDGSKDNVMSFIERAEELRIARNCTKDELFASAIDLFTGPALIWFRSIRNSITDWNTLIQILRRDFLPTDYDEVLWEQIKDRNQGRHERVTIFIAVLENLFSRLTVPCSEEVKIKFIKRNLLACYSSALALVDVATVEALSELCRRIEDANITVKHQNTSRVASLESALTYEAKHSGNDGNKVKCWNCNEDGHIRRDCRKPKTPIHCFGCNEPGVIKPNCPKCTPAVSSSKN